MSGSIALPLCIFLISCFSDLIPNDDKCPKGCDCYTAPKDGYLWKDSSKSLNCENKIPSKEDLNNLQPINTLALKGSILNLNDKYFENLYINNIIFDGGNDTAVISSSISSANPFAGIKAESLEALVFLNIDLQNFDWKIFGNMKDLGLKSIHIENCILKKLEKTNFGSLSSNIISLTIINSQLESIESSTFEGWDSLKMITIQSNRLKDIMWTLTEMPILWYLDLRHNEIGSIPDNLFEKLPKLQILKLDDNKIRLLKWNILEPVFVKQTLREFSIEANLLCATSDVGTVINKITEKNNNLKLPNFFYYSIKNLRCKDVKPGSIYSDDNCVFFSQEYPQIFASSEQDCKAYNFT